MPQPVMEYRRLKPERRVVVVDGLPETQDVLQAVLQPRGIDVIRCRSHRLADWETSPQPPELLVVHGEEQSTPGLGDVPRIVIGTMQTPDDGSVLSHPFHYRDLLSAIDRLLPVQDDEESPVTKAA